MALATRCPHCGKKFRVASDQLKLRGGIVRCGACHEIFDGSAHLVDLDAPAAPAPAPEEVPVYTVDLGHTFEPLGILPEPAQGTASGAAHVIHEPEPAAAEAEQAVPEPEAVAPEPESPAAGPAPAAPEAEPVIADADLHDAGHAAPEAEPVIAEAELHDAGHVVPEPEPVSDEAELHEAEHVPATQEGARAPVIAEAELHDAEHVVPEPEPVIPEPEPLAPEPEPFAPEPEPFAPEPEPIEPEPEPVAMAASYAPHGDRIEPTLAFPVDEELVAAPLPEHHHEDDGAQHAVPPRPDAPGPLPMREAAGIEIGAQAARPPRPRVADARTGRRSRLTPSKIPAPKLRVPEIDEPEFVKRSRRLEQTGKTRRILYGAGSAVLLLALGAQLALGARNELAARYPAAKPALAAACAPFGCRVELPAKIENLVIETGELTTLGANTYLLSTLLRNQGSLVQAWPHVELVLTDTNDKALLRRVFTPAEYLPQGVAPAAGFGARAEQPVKLYFQLDQLKPSGYRIAVFYP